jgi:thiamine biosynthesis lipoprotein
VRDRDHWAGRFLAMASPCDVLIEDVVSQAQAKHIVDAVAACAWRVEKKFSRYRPGSVVGEINDAAGAVVEVDEETANLLDFAATLTQLSEGRFDITSGVLRRAWTFDGGARIPSQEQIDALLPLVGWHKARWTRPALQLQPGMQIDFGGIGKEYAVDTAAAIANTAAPGVSCLVNFGGDVAVVNARQDGKAWRVGVEHSDRLGSPAEMLALRRGGIATSGDSRRFIQSGGRRYSHILDARTGWPVQQAPRSVTVVADTCTQAGSITTLAMLQGHDAGSFLQASGHRFWIQ